MLSEDGSKSDSVVDSYRGADILGDEPARIGGSAKTGETNRHN